MRPFEKFDGIYKKTKSIMEIKITPIEISFDSIKKSLVRRGGRDMRKIATIILALALVVSFAGFAIAQDKDEEQPSLIDFGVDVNADVLYSLKDSKFTGGVGIDAVSVYDILYVGMGFIGSPEGDFFGEGIAGPRITVDLKEGINYLIEKFGHGKVKWLMGDYAPRIGYVGTYNFMNSKEYDRWEHFIVLNIFTF